MARPLVELEIDCPPRVSAGEDVQVNLTVTARAHAEVTEATLRWICRCSYHSRVWSFTPARMSPGWSNVLRKNADTVVSSARLPQLSGLLRDGARAEAHVRIETVETPPSTVTTDGFGSILNLVEARVVLRDGTEVNRQQRVWVRPNRHPAEAISPASGPLQVLSRDGSPGLYAELYRPVEGTLVLRAGPDSVGPGKVDLRLIRDAQWQVHFLVPARAKGTRRSRRNWTEKPNWQEKTMERLVSQTAVKLGTVAAPPVTAHGRAEVGFAFPGPRGTAQTTAWAEGFIAWTLDCVWSAGPRREQAGAPIVMSMPVVPRKQLDGDHRRWLRGWRRGGQAGGVEASTGTV